MSARKLNPDKTYHLQVRRKATVVHEDKAYGDRATLQVLGSDITDELLAKTDIVEPDQVPDPAER